MYIVTERMSSGKDVCVDLSDCCRISKVSHICKRYTVLTVISVKIVHLG